jgi:hypothetical protein
MRRFGFGSIFALSLLVVGVQASRADSIALTSESAGVFGYGVILSPGSPGVSVVNGDTILFTGLFGVTGASAAPGIGFTATFTSTTATFTETGGGATTPSNPSGSPVEIADLFLIDSADTTVGTISYTAITAQGTLSGTAQGPVTPTAPSVPEPSTMVLAGSGLLGLAGAVRRKFVR